MAGLGVRGSYVCVPWLINSLCTPPFSFAKSSEITCQDTGVRRRGVRRRKFLCSSSPSPASCVLECERVPGRSQQPRPCQTKPNLLLPMPKSNDLTPPYPDRAVTAQLSYHTKATDRVHILGFTCWPFVLSMVSSDIVL